MSEEKKGFLLFCNLREFFSEILKQNATGKFPFKLGDCFIIIVSRDITTDVSIRESTYTNTFQSKYDNVDFLVSLLPSVQQMEFVSAASFDTFVDEYTQRLYGERQLKDIISICDVVANRGIPVFIISSNIDYQTQFPYVIREFINDDMGLHGYMWDEVCDSVEKLYDIGDREKIKETIKERIQDVLNTFDKDYFFNTLMDDMEKAYHDILDQKSVEELKKIAKNQTIFISRKDDKERIIRKIIKDIVASGAE